MLGHADGKPARSPLASILCERKRGMTLRVAHRVTYSVLILDCCSKFTRPFVPQVLTEHWDGALPGALLGAGDAARNETGRNPCPPGADVPVGEMG